MRATQFVVFAFITLGWACGGDDIAPPGEPAGAGGKTRDGAGGAGDTGRPTGSGGMADASSDKGGSAGSTTRDAASDRTVTDGAAGTTPRDVAVTDRAMPDVKADVYAPETGVVDSSGPGDGAVADSSVEDSEVPDGAIDDSAVVDGTGPDGTVSDAPEDAAPCGTISCHANEYCCDATCGLCAPNGTPCGQCPSDAGDGG